MNPHPTLHILNKTPEHPRYELCMQALLPSDTLVLIENGVLSIAGAQLNAPCKLYGLKADIAARALDTLYDSSNTVDFEGLVQLTQKHEKVISW
ncbi:sulfurtransferase complex subunit TusB [Marinobacter litoralis]|uniref:sulfurtransferase complex subunit TusB n=1 Tax=Marinobacter litoralis TaxID=187981 RepID=UPI0018EC412E|nr:sulfurtransferase complex subunit TusB [Marinobacter litoralis]MBJ6137804.1 sulfurtransferase complex subunit TusB [Marinobacter litoralis]